ncbi:MAG: hypothetical protein ACYC25_07240 [Paludibacter sp.]
MDSIIEKSRGIDKNYSEEIIKFYRENQSYFDNFDSISEIETIEEIILIKQKYCEALESKAHYKELTVVLKHIFILLTKLKSKSQKHDSYYERAMFYEGIVLGRQEKYSQSNHRFKELLFIDPLNESYKNWYQSNKRKLFDNRLSFSEDIAMIIAFFTTLLGSYIFGKTYTTILIIGFVLYIGIFVFTRIIRKKIT